MKKSRRLLFQILGITCILGMLSMAQSHGQKLNFAFPSPESSALARQVSSPVNLNTGVVNVQVPLYTVQSGGITIPIQLSYATSGIKVRDFATWVGLGWNLTSGGKVTRVVKRQPDENGFCKVSSPDGESASQLSSWTQKNYYSRLENDFDGEPDLFFYELPGRSGMFVVDPQGKAFPIPYQDIKIEWVNRSYFKITDESGTLYVFGQVDKDITTTKTSYDDEEKVMPEYTSTWHLESITGALKETVTFIYEAGGTYSFSNFDESYNVEVDCKNPYSPSISKEDIVKTEVYTTISPRYLKGIRWNGGYLGFVSSSSRKDLNKAKRLDAINYFASDGQFIKSVKFDYNDLRVSLDSRLMLSEVRDSMSAGCRLISKFEYNSYSIGVRNTKDYDHWGYYNGSNNETNRPTIDISLYHAPILGANRTPSLVYTAASSLRRVYNNLGGYTEYEYELNDAFFEDVYFTIGGLRIRSIKQVASRNDSLVTRYYYKKYVNETGTMAETSGTIVSGGGYCTYVDEGGYTCKYLLESTMVCDVFDLNGSSVSYSTVIVENPNGSKDVYDYTSNESNPDTRSTVYPIPLNWMDNHPNRNIWFVNNSWFWKRGLVRKHRSFDSEDNLVNQTDYFYWLNDNVKREINGYQCYTTVFNGIARGHLCEYKWVSQPVYLWSTISEGKDMIYQRTEYKYDTTHIVQREIINTQYNPYMKNRTVMTYPFDYQNATLYSDSIASAIAMMNSRHMYNYPIEKIMYKGDLVVGGEINEYKCILSGVLPCNVKRMKVKKPKANYVPYACVSHKMVCDPDYEIVSIVDSYNIEAFTPSQTRVGTVGKPTSVLYGYKNTIPVAFATNATLKQIYYTSFEETEVGAIICDKAKTGNKVFTGIYNIPLQLHAGQYALSYWKSVDRGISWTKEVVLLNVTANIQNYAIGNASCYIDEVRIHPASAQMTTTTYLPGIGKTSETDENGFTVYYEYDGFGRMLRVLDNDRQVIKNYQYMID